MKGSRCRFLACLVAVLPFLCHGEVRSASAQIVGACRREELPCGASVALASALGAPFKISGA